MINVVIIEDDHILLQTYKIIIEQEADMAVCGAYTSYEFAEKHLTGLKPDVLMLDVQLPGISGIDAIPLVKTLSPRTNIIILTVFESEDHIFNALRNGATGYLTKDSPSVRIIDAIREAKQGGGPMSMKIARMVIRSFERAHDSPLSKRETEILQLIMQGKKQNQIAQELFIEVGTVKTHIKNIYLKLDVCSKSDAINVAKKNKYV